MQAPPAQSLIDRWTQWLATDAPRDHFKPGATACSSASSSIPRSIRSAARYGVLLRPGKKEARWACGTVSPRFEMVSPYRGFLQVPPVRPLTVAGVAH